MHKIITQVAELRHIQNPGIITIRYSPGGYPEIHIDRKAFLFEKNVHKWETTIKPNGRYGYREDAIINGVNVFSLLNKNEYEGDFRLVEETADKMEVTP